MNKIVFICLMYLCSSSCASEEYFNPINTPDRIEEIAFKILLDEGDDTVGLTVQSMTYNYVRRTWVVFIGRPETTVFSGTIVISDVNVSDTKNVGRL